MLYGIKGRIVLETKIFVYMVDSDCRIMFCDERYRYLR